MHPRYRGLRRTRPHRLCALSVVLAALPGLPAVAAELRVYARGSGGLSPAAGQGLNLHAERRDLAVDYADDGGGDRLEIARIGVAWFESPLPWLRLGLEGGGQEIQQGERAATAGLELTGYYAAFRAGARWPVTRRVGLELETRLGYAQSDDGSEPAVELEWWSASARPAVAVRLADAVTLRAGVRGHWIDGDERLRGTPARTTAFREDGVAGGFFGLDIHTGDGGRVGVRADGGPVEAVRLVFERSY